MLLANLPVDVHSAVSGFLTLREQAAVAATCSAMTRISRACCCRKSVQLRRWKTCWAAMQAPSQPWGSLRALSVEHLGAQPDLPQLHCAFPQLTHLSIRSADSLSRLEPAHLPASLTHLKLRSCLALKVVHLRQLVARLPNLVHLDLTGSAVESLAEERGGPSQPCGLQELLLIWCVHLTYAQVSAVLLDKLHFPRLRRVDVQWTNLLAPGSVGEVQEGAG
jgi:hypothetical protein